MVEDTIKSLLSTDELRHTFEKYILGRSLIRGSYRNIMKISTENLNLDEETNIISKYIKRTNSKQAFPPESEASTNVFSDVRSSDRKA